MAAPYRTGGEHAAEASTLVYVPKRRSIGARALDVLVIAAAITGAVKYARRTEVSCAWEGRTAQCEVASTGPLGARQTSALREIRGVAYRSGNRLGLVTSAHDKDDLAAFGTRDVRLWDDESATALRAFFDEGAGPPVRLADGPERPLLWTLGMFACVLAFAFLTRPQAIVVTIDPRERLLRLRSRGLLGGVEQRWELGQVRGFDVENADADRHRVRLELDGGRRLPLTEAFFEGAHHHEFIERAREALAGARAT